MRLDRVLRGRTSISACIDARGRRTGVFVGHLVCTALKSPLTPQLRARYNLLSARGFGGRCASADSPRQLEEVIQCLLQTLVRSQFWVYWLARFVDNELAPAVRPQTMRAGFRHARDRGPQRTDAPMQLPRGHLVRTDSCSSRGWRSPQGLRRSFFRVYFPASFSGSLPVGPPTAAS
jgi:hypothetical protein